MFGDGVAASSVTFTIGGTDAAPDITGTTATPAAGITAEVGAVDHSTGDDDESSASARVSVKFTNATGDQSRTLTIKVKVEHRRRWRHLRQAERLARPHQGRRRQGRWLPHLDRRALRQHPCIDCLHRGC